MQRWARTVKLTHKPVQEMIAGSLLVPVFALPGTTIPSLIDEVTSSLPPECHYDVRSVLPCAAKVETLSFDNRIFRNMAADLPFGAFTQHAFLNPATFRQSGHHVCANLLRLNTERLGTNIR